MATPFPLEQLQLGSFHPVLLGSDETGGAALGGAGQVVDWSAGGLWAAELGGLELWQPDHLRLYRALLMACRGGGEVDVPMLDEPQRPFEAGQTDAADLPFSDGTYFQDGTGWVGQDLDYEVVSDALEGDVSLTLRRIVGARLRGGELWGLDHPSAGPRAYCVESVSEESPDGVFTLSFGAPLREATPAGSKADFQNPRCRMRLLTPWTEAWPKVNGAYEAQVSLRFIESFAHL